MIKQIPALLAAALMFICPLNCCFAAPSAQAEVPVKLTVIKTTDSISVTVPSFLPVRISDGTVITSKDAKISNNSPSVPVRVKDVTLKGGEYRIGSYESFSGDRTIALKINGIPGKGEGKMDITEKAFPVIGPGLSVPVEYKVKISEDASELNGKEVARVIFTVERAE